MACKKKVSAFFVYYIDDDSSARRLEACLVGFDDLRDELFHSAVQVVEAFTGRQLDLGLLRLLGRPCVVATLIARWDRASLIHCKHRTQGVVLNRSCPDSFWMFRRAQRSE